MVGVQPAKEGQDPWSIFQVLPQQEEPIDLEKSIESMIQYQNDYIRSQIFNRLEEQMGHLSTQLMIGIRKLSLPNFFDYF